MQIAGFTTDGLQNVKVGDKVAPIIVDFSRKNARWNGMIHEVKKVGAKRFYVAGQWIEQTKRPRNRRETL